jgi:hypothetical protein
MYEWPFFYVTFDQWDSLTLKNKGKAEYAFEQAVKKCLLEQEIEHRIETEVQKRLLSLQKPKRTKLTKWRVIENKHPPVASPPDSKAVTKPKIVADTRITLVNSKKREATHA